MESDSSSAVDSSARNQVQLSSMAVDGARVNSRTSTRRFDRMGVAFATISLVGGLLASAALGLSLHREEQRRINESMDQRSQSVRIAVAAEAQRYVDTLTSLSASLGSQNDLTWGDFQAITSHLAEERMSGAAGIGFVISTDQVDLTSLQRHWQEKGNSDFAINPWGSGEHRIIVLNRSFDASADGAGRDLMQSPEAVEAMNVARSSGKTAASKTYVLLRDRSLPAEQQQQSFLFATPVYGSGSSTDAGKFRGWLVMGMHGNDFIDSTLRSISQGLVNVSLTDTISSNQTITVATLSNGKAAGGPSLEREQTLEIAQRPWQLSISPTSKLVGEQRKWDDLIIVIGTAILSVLLSAFVFVLATSRRRALRKVDAATHALREDIHRRELVEKELRETQDDLVTREAYLDALINAVDVAIVTGDSEGRILHVNSYGREVLGYTPDDETVLEGTSVPGITLTEIDGKTPLPREWNPLRRALHEGELRGQEVVVHGEGQRPRTMLVHGRALRDSTGRTTGVVIAAHDISELRARESELSTFAAVAAHDLKSPLAAIAGYAELLYDDISDEVDERAGRFMLHITASVQRMRGLIDQLLGFATAKDSALRLERVQLDGLAMSVANERTGHLAASERPEITIGPLPTVTADESMIRQVFDNLIGNALKYVVEDTRAEVQIGARLEDDGTWRIEVADRGIGIPATERSSVFDSFQRAGGAAEYSGHGLGLAICARIIERHNGRIGVEENPGGGARFWFTLPSKIVPSIPKTPVRNIPSSGASSVG